jgi:hypothetical protein
MCKSKAEGGKRCKGRKGRASSTTLTSTGSSQSSGFSSTMQRSRTAVLRDAQNQLDDLLDAVIGGAPVDSSAILISDVDAAVASQIADAITATLRAHGYPPSKWWSHLLCGALAAVAQAMEAGKDLAETAVTQSVTAMLASSGITSPVAGLAARAVVDVLMKLPPVQHWDNVRCAVQVLAVSVCPSVANHREVAQQCLRPLASELLSDEIQQELTALFGNGSVAAA